MMAANISDETYCELEKLSNSQIDELVKVLGIGFLNDIDKEDKIFVISNEQPESELKDALKKLKQNKNRLVNAN